MGTPSDFDRGGRGSSLVETAPPFVGRKQEVDRMAEWFMEVASGRPRIVLIQGEAGIGKTRLIQEARSIARRLQMQVCFSRCYEDLALPYLPFIESLLPEVEQVADAKRILGEDLDVIRRLLHGTGSIAETSSLTRSDRIDEDKLRLFLAVGHGTVALARTRPTVFIVDDLHWADPHSLDLFDHLALAVAEMALREPTPLGIVATYRPMDATERLSRMIARLQREEICRSFALSGLDELEIRDLIGGLGLVRPSHQLTATVGEATQGNPLFIQEVVHHLVEQDALQEQGGYLVATAAPSELRLPEEVTGAIVGRARGLSEGCWKVLTLASFVGDRFSIETLRAVSGIVEDELLGLLEEGARQRLVRSEGQTFQFAHPLIRHVFYHEPSAARRERIHRQIAESLQHLYATSIEAHLLEIAHHLVRARSAAPADVVAEYARRAADHAFGVFAWSEAARYYQAALSAVESMGRLSTADRASLHYRAGLAHYHNRDVGPCLHHYDEAIKAYQSTEDVEGLAQALMEKTRTQLTLAAVPLGVLVDLQPLEHILAVLGDREPALRGRLLAMEAEAYRHGRQAEKAKERAQQALEIAQRLGDDHLCANASFALALSHTNDLALEESLVAWQNARTYARRASDSIREGWALHRTPVPLTLLGRFDEAQAVALEACEVTRRSHDWGNHSLGLSHLACLAVARGHFGASEERAHETLLTARSRYPWGGFRSLLALACARGLRGAWAEAEDALDVLVEPGRVFEQAGPTIQVFVRVLRQLIRARAGTADKGLERLAEELMRVVGSDTYSLGPLGALVELGELAGTPSIADIPYSALSRAAERGVVFSTGWMCLVPRVLGSADALNQRWSAAEAHFQAAIDVAASAGARPELGRTYLDYARMLTARGSSRDRVRESELVSKAMALFLELDMQPFAKDAEVLAKALGGRTDTARTPPVEYPDNLSEREVQVLVRMAQGRSNQEIAGELVLGSTTIAGHVRSILEKISADDAAAATAYAVGKGLTWPSEMERGVGERGSPALHIILVTDIAASGAIIHRAGDARAHELLQIHNAVIRRCLGAFHGTEVDHTGDGIEASFTSASRAVECAIMIQALFSRHNDAHPTEPIRVRIGINAGEPISTEGGRLFGTAVHAAFGICARAQPGQILVSDVVRHLVAGKGFQLTSRARVVLKGLPGRTQLHEVSWQRGPA